MDTMATPHRLTLTLAMAAIAVAAAYAADPPAEPRPVASGIAAFEAPAEPPEEDAVPEVLAPEPAGPLALIDALALALMRNPNLQAFSWETRAGEARTLQARKIPNPEVDIRLYRLGIPRDNRALDEARSRIILSQVFELGGKRSRRVELAETERYLAGWDYEAMRNDVATLVTDRFVAVLGAQRRVESWTRLTEFLDEMQAGVAALVESGTMRSLEVQQARRQAGLARIERRQAETDLAMARVHLSATWANTSPQFTVAVGELDVAPPIPDIATVMQMAQPGPSIARWDAELARRHAALALAKSSRVPDLTVGVGARWEDDFNERDTLVDFEIDLPIFDRKQGDIREARYGIARAEAERQAAEARSGALISQLYYTLEEAHARATTFADEIVPAARTSFEAHRVGFERRVDGLEDLLDAGRDLARYEAEYAEALVDYHQALAALEGLVGFSLVPE